MWGFQAFCKEVWSFQAPLGMLDADEDVTAMPEQDKPSTEHAPKVERYRWKEPIWCFSPQMFLEEDTGLVSPPSEGI